jgi:maltose alpha-D-glucosyltransferase/alpha-amylase
MQWNSDRNAGFSKGDPASLYSPVISDPVYGFQSINVEAQERTRSSLLNWVKRLVRIRQRYDVFSTGKLNFLHPENKKVLAFTRTNGNQAIVVICNLSRHAQPAHLDLSEYIGATPVELFGETPFPKITDQPYQLSLGPYMFLWFRLDRPGAKA